MQCSNIIDPSHPDADWSGFVPQNTCRKHFDHENEITITTNEKYGFICPGENAKTNEWMKSSRRAVPHKESDFDYHCHEESGNHRAKSDTVSAGNSHGKSTCRSSTFALIGGPVPVNEPERFDPSAWETETYSAGLKKATGIHQLTDNGRAMNGVRSKRGVCTDSIDGVNTKQSMGCGDTDDYDDGNTGGGSSNNNFAAGNEHSMLTHNFMKDIAKQLAESPHILEVRCSKSFGSGTAPFATDGNLPTDPYQTASGERRKDLLLENFSSVVPGYTGKRTFIN